MENKCTLKHWNKTPPAIWVAQHSTVFQCFWTSYSKTRGCSSLNLWKARWEQSKCLKKQTKRKPTSKQGNQLYSLRTKTGEARKQTEYESLGWTSLLWSWKGAAETNLHLVYLRERDHAMTAPRSLLSSTIYLAACCHAAHWTGFCTTSKHKSVGFFTWHCQKPTSLGHPFPSLSEALRMRKT